MTRLEPGTHEAIEALLRQVEQYWKSLELERLETLWDASAPPLYIAEEDARVHTDFESLRRYWSTTRAAMEKMGLALGVAHLTPLAPDLLSAVYSLHWECVVKGQGGPIGGENRACAVLRRVQGRWRFTQYVEAPLAPIVYLRKLYERSVTPGFGQ